MGRTPQYSIKELSERTGIEIRTIRWYISEGLLRGPEALGRNAYYTEHHRKRLEVIKLLRDTYGMPLAQIRKYVLMAGDEDIEVAAVPFPPMGTEPILRMREAPDATTAMRMRKMRMRKPDDAEDDIAASARTTENPWDSIDEKEVVAPESELESRARFMSVRDLLALQQRGPIPQLLEALRAVLKDRRIPRQARAEEVYRISVTPEITLEVAGGMKPAERALFEQLADHLREVLLGGGKSDEA